MTFEKWLREWEKKRMKHLLTDENDDGEFQRELSLEERNTLLQHELIYPCSAVCDYQREEMQTTYHFKMAQNRV